MYSSSNCLQVVSYARESIDCARESVVCGRESSVCAREKDVCAQEDSFLTFLLFFCHKICRLRRTSDVTTRDFQRSEADVFRSREKLQSIKRRLRGREAF